MRLPRCGNHEDEKLLYVFTSDVQVCVEKGKEEEEAEEEAEVQRQNRQDRGQQEK